jgi:hypothetical protein
MLLAFTLNVPASKKPATTKTAVALKTAAAPKTTTTSKLAASKPAASKTANTKTTNTIITKNSRKRPAATLSTAAVLGKKACTCLHKSTKTVNPANIVDNVLEEEDEV